MTLAGAMAWAAPPLPTTAQVPGAAREANKVPPKPIVAARVTFKGELSGATGEITAGEVSRLLAAAVGGRTVAPQAAAQLTAQSLLQLIERRFVAAFLLQQKITAPEDEVSQRVQTALAKLGKDEKSALAALAKLGLSRSALQRLLAWELAWEKYLNLTIDDERLQKFFDEHRREYDGTQLRVSHVLLRPQRGLGRSLSEETRVVQLAHQALKLKQEIVNGSISFAEAARRHSAGPSRTDGGDLGYIPRRHRMVESFSKAAFALKEGEVSDPVLTTFGVHLITVTEELPGTATWKDAQDELRTALSVELFAEAAKAMKGQAQVEYSGALPYLDPKTGKLILPRNSAQSPADKKDESEIEAADEANSPEVATPLQTPSRP